MSFLLSDVPHVVRRKASGELSIKIADRPFEPCTEENVRELLPIRAFSQKQLSAVGARLEELRRFVYAPIRADLAVTEERIAALRTELRAEFARVQRKRTLHGEIATHHLERDSLTERILKLRGSLRGLSVDDQATISRQPEYEAKQRVVQALERDRQAARRTLDASLADLAKIPSIVDRRTGTPNHALLDTLNTRTKTWVDEALEMIKTIRAELDQQTASGVLKPLFHELADWKAKREVQCLEYEEAKSRSNVHEDTLSQIQELVSCKAPCSRCRRQLVSKDEYNPSRRNSAPSSPGFLQASACVRMRSRYSAGKRRRWAFAGTSGSGSVARDVTEGPKAAVALRAPSASAPSATSISTAAGMRVIHRTLPAPTLISPGRLSHGLLAQGVSPGRPSPALGHCPATTSLPAAGPHHCPSSACGLRAYREDF